MNANLLALAAIIVAALGVGLPLQYSIRKDRREQEEQRIAAAVAVVKEARDLALKDRDYFRDRADGFEQELRRSRDEERRQ